MTSKILKMKVLHVVHVSLRGRVAPHETPVKKYHGKRARPLATNTVYMLKKPGAVLRDVSVTVHRLRLGKHSLCFGTERTFALGKHEPTLRLKRDLHVTRVWKLGFYSS